MWVYKSGRSEDKQLVYYIYEANRSHQNVMNHLEGFSGICQTGGYQAYDKLKNITHAGCMIHARRKFIEVVDSMPKGYDFTNTITGTVITSMKKLFAIEKKLGNANYDEILLTRQRESKPIFDLMMEEVHTASKSRFLTEKVKSAMTYLINQEIKIREYLNDGRIEISTNGIERAIRPFTIGRNNWIFCNTPHGAKVSSFYYSLIESAKANKLDVYKYIEYLLTEIKDKKLTEENLEKLMPYSSNLPEYLKYHSKKKK